MAAGDISTSMLAELGLRLEDAAATVFTTALKLVMLSKAQTQVAQLVHNVYLSELETISATTLDFSTTYALSGIGNTVFRGAEGILKVAIQIGGSGSFIWATEIDLKQLKRTENTYLAGSNANPLYYIFANSIYPLTTTTALTKGKVYYLKAPPTITTDVDPILNKALHPLILMFAEALCWGIDGKLDRKQAALDMAMTEIEILNARYFAAEGIGTSGRDT